MKKLLTVLTLGALVLLIAMPAMAGSIYGEFMFAGSWDMDGFKKSYDGDVSQLTFGLNYPINEFLFGAEFSTGSMKAPSGYIGENDFTLVKLKGGCYLINNKKTQLAATLGFSNMNLEDSDEVITGWLLGVDLLSVLNEELDLEAAFAFSVKGDYEYTGYNESLNEDCSIYDFKIKFIYHLQNNLAATASYSYSSSILDLPSDPGYKFSGLSLGIKCNF